MRWNLNSAEACTLGDLRAHLEGRAETYVRGFEQHEQPLTTAQRAELTAEGELMKPELAAAITSACDLAKAHSEDGSTFLVSASAYENTDGTRSFAVFVDRLAAP